MNRIHNIPGCPTLGATDCIGLACKRAAAGAAEPVIAIAAATDHPLGVVHSVADDNSTLDIAFPCGDEPVPVRLSADCEEGDYLVIDADAKFKPAATGVRCAQAAESAKSGALALAYILPPITIA